ncbi:MAG TPA: MFS transporter [Spirochaetia bacterium]|nr:MFS transporter [Spirochaetia bacterium]
MAEPNQASLGPWVLFSTIFASSMAFIDGTALNVALPAIQTGLHATGVQLLWIVNAYLLMLAALIPVGGSLGDLFGRRRVFAVGISLFMVASLICGLSPSARFLVWARLVQGIGSSLMIPGSLAIISSFFGPSERGKAIGTWSAATTIVTVIGPVLGGVLSSAGLWRGVFLINIPLGIAALIPLLVKVPESRGSQAGSRIDVPGAGLLVAGLAGVTFGLMSAPDHGFRDPRIIGSLSVGIAALGAFIVVEARTTRPMIPLTLFSSRTFSGTNLLTLALYGALSVGTFFLSLNLVQAQGYSMALAGFAFTPFALVLTVLSRWAGRIVDRSGPRVPLVIGPAIAGLAFLFLSRTGLTPGPSQYWVSFFPGVVLLGIGMGVTVAPLTTTVMGSVATQLSGTASGINNAVSRTAGVLAIAVVGALSLVLFAHGLDSRASAAGLSAPVRQALAVEASRLAAAGVPSNAAPQDAEAIRSAVRMAFVDTFKVVMLVCAALAWIGAGLAGLFVERRLRPAT